MSHINPLDHPICFVIPDRINSISGWHEHIPFAMLLVDILKPKIIVELGTQYGTSYCSFCQAVKELKLDTRCYAVDTWQGDTHTGSYGAEVLADLHKHHDPLYGSFSSLMQTTFDEALPRFENKTIDILHIDGYHTYEVVKHDFELWLPKVSKRGIVLLHDINYRERDFGVWKYWDEIKTKYPHFELLHSAGLGVLAVDEVNSGELNSLLNATTEETCEIRNLFFRLGREMTAKLMIENRDRALQSFQRDLAEKSSYINNLKVNLTEKDREITEFSNVLQNKNTQINDLNNSLQVKNIRIKDLELHLEEKDREIAKLNNALQTKDTQINDLNNSLQVRDSQVNQLQIQMQQSITLKLQARYQIIIERLFRHGTKRRYYYEMGLIGTRVIMEEGWGSFWRKYRTYRTSKKPVRIRTSTSKLNIAIDYQDNIIEILNKKISIVIPTKNAGHDFDFTIEKIKNQKGIREIEIIIVDSGSHDNTIQLAEKHQAKIYRINPDDFSHGLTRNYGAEKATGEYVLFMVQDAIPISDYWLYCMVKALEHDKNIAAVTCRQVPRSDADLFGSFAIWNHYRVLEYSGDKVSLPISKFNELSPLQKRKLAGLEDVCCLIKKDIFSKFEFLETKYAEDLQLGIEILKNGYSIAFLRSTGIIHSHDRSPSYVLRRSYVDNKMLPEILSYEPAYYYVSNDSLKTVLGNVIALYAALNLSTQSLDYSDNSVNEVFVDLKHSLKTKLNKDPTELKAFARSENQLDTLFDEIQKVIGIVDIKPHPLIIQSYFNVLDDFELYLGCFKTLNNKNDEFRNSLYKILATVAGSAFANYYLFRVHNQRVEETLSFVDNILSREV
jgi:glycosyltransferase involved in cell wall biosynthesis